MTSAALKRNLWCRWAHHWNPSKLSGYTRNYCEACQTWPDPPKPPGSPGNHPGRFDRIADELRKHQAPRYRDPDREDRGALNCRCGVRIPPRDGVRDWDAYDLHVATEIDALT